MNSKVLTLSQTKILDSSKLKEFADNNYKFDENGRKFIKHVENTVGKRENALTSNFSFSHIVFKRLELQTHKNQGLFGKGLIQPSTTQQMLDCLNPFPNKPWFLRVCSTSLLKSLREKEKLLVTSNFSFSHSVFYPFG